MSVEKAKAHYTGAPGYQKLNCAQSIAQAFKDGLDAPQDIVDQLGACGGGRAPEGQCGSLYAAKVMLGKTHPEVIKDCEEALMASAGSIHCRAIRASKKLSCVGCVETVAGCISRI